MSAADFTEAPSWGGRPIATRIADATPRQRVVVRGTVRGASTIPVGSAIAYACVLTDGTGELQLLFLGRDRVPGLLPGASCTVEGTATMVGGTLAVWNPRYRFELAAPIREEEP